MEKKSAAKKFYMHKISSLINIRKIVTIHYQELLPHYVYPEESHDFWEIIYADKDDIDNAGWHTDTSLPGRNAFYKAQRAAYCGKP